MAIRRATLRATLCTVMLGLAMLLLPGCGGEEGLPIGEKQTDIDEVKALLPNLSGLDASAAEWRIETIAGETGADGGPAMRLTGVLRLTERGARDAGQGAEWATVPPNLIPAEMDGRLPDGPVLSSEALNFSFSANDVFQQGVVFAPGGGEFNDVYFLATNLRTPVPGFEAREPSPQP